jgi:pilus assembly protein CpaF
MLSRLETLVLMGAEIPLLAVRKQIASALDIIVHLGRLRDRSRRLLEITEVTGCQDGEIRLNPIYEFVETGEEQGRVRGSLVQKGELRSLDKLKRAGISIDTL